MQQSYRNMGEKFCQQAGMPVTKSWKHSEVTNTCVSLVHEKYQNTKEKTLSMDKLFSIKDPKRKNHIEHDWWKDVTSSVFLVIKALELQTLSQQKYNSTIPTKGT